MKKLLKNCKMINVFTGEIQNTDILIDGNKIHGFGSYNETDADKVEDLKGKYVCPGFIDGHIHVESTMLTPVEFAKVAILHGTTAIVEDPHEITNVLGTNGLKYMLQSSLNLPTTIYFMVPSCVPATCFDESFEDITADKMTEFLKDDRVLGLAEMMNYPGVLFKDKSVFEKIELTKKFKKLIDGHAPLLTGNQLNDYIFAGIQSDHECTSLEEGVERISKGQWLMVRQGTAAKNLNALSGVIDKKYSNRCLFVTDDKEPADLLKNGHLDNTIKTAIAMGKDAITCIQMATINSANCFKLQGVGAIAPNYVADLIVMNDLNTMDIVDVYKNGEKVVENKKVLPFDLPKVNEEIQKDVYGSFKMNAVSVNDFIIDEKGIKNTRVIKIIPNELLTDEWITEINYDENNGIDLKRDILKICVMERHRNTGHIGKGFINGIGLKSGAIASSVSHDSHNLIVIGTNDKDMQIASERIRQMGGGNVVVDGGKVISEFALPIAGLMSDLPIEKVAKQCEDVRNAVKKIGVNENIAPFMNMAFVSLPVIPTLKLTTLGLVNVNDFKLVPLTV